MTEKKRVDLILAFLLVPLDFLFLVLAGLTSYFVRFAQFTAEIRPIIFELPFNEFLQLVILFSILWIIIFSFSGLYRVEGFKKRLPEIWKIIVACSFGFLLIILFLFFRRELFSSRFILLAAWFFAIFYVSVGRIIVRNIEKALYRKGIGIRKILIIGHGRIFDLVYEEFQHSYEKKIIHVFSQLSEETKREIQTFVKKEDIDEVIQLDLSAPKELLLELYDWCDEHRIAFSFSADFFGTISPNFFYTTIADIPIIELRRTPLFGWGRIVKRLMDIVGALFGIILFSPLMILTAILIRIDSKGPIFYKNKRMGIGREFFTYKFRYMHLECCTGENYGGEDALKLEADLIRERNIRQGPLYKIQGDPRKTRVGRIIERVSIDELPQFFNVLKGEMSLVGPRPHQGREVAQYLPHHRKVFAIKPGITGLAAISGRSDLDFEDEVRLELFYIENWSLFLDCIIFLKTPFAMIRKRKNI